MAFGYETDLWTTRRLAEVIAARYGVRFNPNYLADPAGPQPPVAGGQGRRARRAGDRPVGGPGVVAHQKKSRDERAHVVLIDESGSFIDPTVRRTWALRGRTPVLTGFGRHRDKVSTIAAIGVAPGRRRVGLYWRTDPGHYIDAAGVVGFLQELLRHLRGRVIVVWDGGGNHKGPLIRGLLSLYPRPHLERLPAYAPDLNPVEFVWSYLKHGMMANYVPRDVRQLDQVVDAHSCELAGRPALIRSPWKGPKLPFLDKNPTT